MRSFKSKINEEEVTKCFCDCLFREEEIDENGQPAPEKVIVKGLTATFYLNKNRLENYRPKIEYWIKQLPTDFIKGYTFLNLCFDNKGIQWTSLHRTCEQLLVMSIGLNLACYCTSDREFWNMLPGGMPYIQFENL